MAPNREKEQFGPLGVPWVFNMAWIKEMVWKAIVFLCGLQNFRKSSTGAAPKPPYDMTLQCITLQHTVWNGYGSSVQVWVGWEVLSLYITLPPYHPLQSLLHSWVIKPVNGGLFGCCEFPECWILWACWHAAWAPVVWPWSGLYSFSWSSNWSQPWWPLGQPWTVCVELVCHWLAVGAAWIFEASIVEVRGPMNCCGRPQQENSRSPAEGGQTHVFVFHQLWLDTRIANQHHVCVGHCWRRSKQGGYQHQHWFVKYWKAVGEQTWR